jgi:hypothetical protein
MSLDLNLITDIIHGRYQRVPDLRKKVVRIFVSSTFTGKSNLNFSFQKVF